jgi:hypothetical protein
MAAPPSAERKIRRKNMTMLSDILVQTEEGRKALHYKRNGWQMPSDGPEMGAVNQALAQIYAQANEPGEILAALAQGRPVTSRLVHNARLTTPGYEEAYQAMLAMLGKLPKEMASVLDKDIRRLMYRAHAPLGEQVVFDQQGLIRLYREAYEAPWFLLDRWWLQISRHATLALAGQDIPGDWEWSPVYLATGHLSARPLTMTSKVWPAADGAMVISVLVEAQRRDRPDGAWATEIILRHGEETSFSLWRDLEGLPMPKDWAMLPHQGTMVRQGDVVLQGAASGDTHFWEWESGGAPPFMWDVEVPPGRWLKADSREGDYFRPDVWPDEGLVFKHRDHYAVRLVKGEDPETKQVHDIVKVFQIPGVTQYRPRDSRQD